MSTHALVYTEDPGGGNRVFLDRLIPTQPSIVTGLKWTKNWPGGDSGWSCNLSADADLSHLGLNIGRCIVITKGGSNRFRGRLALPKRGTPSWQLSGPGAYSVAITSAGSGGFMAVAPSGNAYNLDDIVQAAQGRGLPWSVPATLPGGSGVTTAGTAPSGSCDLDTAFSTVGKALGQCVSLSTDLALTMGPPPTEPLYVLRPQQALTPQLTGFTQGVGIWNSSGGVVTTQNAAAIKKWDHLEGSYDMTALNLTDAATATQYLQNWLAVNLVTPTYTDQLTVQPGQLFAINNGAMGGPVDLSTVQPGCLINVYDINPDHSHLLAPGPLQILIGQTDYDDDSDTLTITPVGAVGTNLLAALYAGQGGAL